MSFRTMSFRSLATAAALVVIGMGSASAASLGAAQTLGSRSVTYCGACLCTATPPAMPVAGDWVPNGQLLGGAQVMKFRPAGQAVSTPTRCIGPG